MTHFSFCILCFPAPCQNLSLVGLVCHWGIIETDVSIKCVCFEVLLHERSLAAKWECHFGAARKEVPQHLLALEPASVRGRRVGRTWDPLFFCLLYLATLGEKERGLVFGHTSLGFYWFCCFWEMLPCPSVGGHAQIQPKLTFSAQRWKISPGFWALSFVCVCVRE